MSAPHTGLTLATLGRWLAVAAAAALLFDSLPEARANPQPAPAAIGAAPEPHFDLAVNNAPAAQVFLQLAQGTPYNMLVSPDVSGTLSLTLRNTTVAEAMDTLRELFGYDYRIVVYSNAVQTRL